MKNRDSSAFWPSYADLMTSLFFIMLVLYVVTVVVMQGTIGVDAERFQQIQGIERALQQLDSTYYRFNPDTKRFQLAIDVNFPSEQPRENQPLRIENYLSPPVLTRLTEAGRELHGKMNRLVREKNVSYLLVIEGNTQRNERLQNYVHLSDEGYKLSYRRALLLRKFWESQGFRFNDFNNCEVLVVGSGYFGKGRVADEAKNRRFTIQITAKLGDFKKGSKKEF